jgi:hypothetical protein
VFEVPRRQSAGRCCPRDVVAEIEVVVEEKYEGEIEDGVEPVREVESADARNFRCVSEGSIFRFNFTAAPKYSAARHTSRGDKIARGPAEKNKSIRTARTSPTLRRK